jgi:nucleotide-binding universal stress UspA family protein
MRDALARRSDAMVTIKRILCPVDFSEFSRRALDHAVAVARWYDSEITALHVMSVASSSPAYLYGSPILAETIALPPIDMQPVLDELRKFVGGDGSQDGRIRSVVSTGPTAAEIVRESKELPADLIVMGTHGRSGFQRLLLGSVTEKVLRQVTCPVLTVPPHTAGAVPVGPVLFKRILCPVDFSEPSLNALRYAMSLAQEADARLNVLHVMDIPAEYESVEYGVFDLAQYRQDYAQSAMQKLKAAIPASARTYCSIEETFAVGKAYGEILRVASEQAAELIVMGVHGRGAVDLTLFGSTTQHVLRQASCPVLTLRSK